MNNKKTPWEARFTWTWVSYDEICKFTQEDFDKRAKDFYDRGITHAIIFTLTHFRIGFRPYWDVIHAAFKKLCDACHKYDIKVIEHNSSALWHDLYCSGGWRRLEEDIESYTNFQSCVEDWIEVPRYLLNEPEAYGHKLYDMTQIDGRTGKRARMEAYNLNVFCYNNPEFKDMYKKYRADELKEVPFDGIMDDDIQWFGDKNACTCKYCREKFKKETGFDLPEPKDWDKFFNNYDDPAYIAWLQFKRRSTGEWWRELEDHYVSLGFNMIRPNYASDILKWAPTLSPFTTCLDKFTFIFQENWFSAIMKNSYPDFAVEAIHRFAAAEKNGVPSMSMFYPDTEDSVYFSWALSRTWGQLYTGTCEGMDITGMEKKYRDFESENIAAYSNPKKLEDVAFYYSGKTRDFTLPQYEMAEKYSLNCLGVMQASIFGGFGTNMAFEDDSVDRLCTHKVLLTAFSGMVTDAELSNFKEYMERGGRFIVMGDFANVDESNKERNVNDTLKKLGVSATAKKLDAVGDMKLCYNGADANITNMIGQLEFNGAEPIATLGGKTVGIRQQVGKGEFIWIAAKVVNSEFQKTIASNRRVPNPDPAESQPSLWDHQAQHSGKILELLIDREVEVTCDEKELLIGAYNTDAGIAINISNVAGAISEKAELVRYTDPIPSFLADAPKLPEIKISVKCDGAKSVTLKTPESAGEVKIPAACAEGKVSFTVPANTFASYALIVIEK